MKISPVAAIVVAGFVLLAPVAMAQTPGAAPARSATAVVDMGSIMKEASRFNAAMERLKAEFEAKGEELKKEGERGNQLTEELRNMPANSPERKEFEQKILRMRADYEIKGKRITEDIRDAESKIVYDLSRELQAELARYGQATGTMLILRANPVPPNLTDPRIVLQEIHKPIVYQANLDATSLVLDSLNRGAAPTTAAGNPPGGGPAARNAAAPQRPYGR